MTAARALSASVSPSARVRTSDGRPLRRRTPRLKAKYREEIAPALIAEFNHANVNQVAGLTKIVVNMGVGEAARDSKLIEGAITDLTAITGQKPQVTKARKSIAQFKLREGQPIGAHVTLRGDRMWEFLDRLLSIALPRIRDFRGLNPKSVRRPRQLHVRSQRAVDVPRDQPGQVSTACAAWTSPSSRPRPPTTRVARCSSSSASPSRRSDMAKTSLKNKAASQAQVRRARLHPVPEVRTSALGVPQVRPVPHLLPRDGSRRRAARHHQEQLVNPNAAGPLKGNHGEKEFEHS